MYLPQFHRINENDEWWGEGFTDWVSTRQAGPLFERHYQPHEPLDDFYYDLLDKNVLKWQSQVMKNYAVDGQCFYHYWFKDGRKILEKPAENLLAWKDIDMPFCFCWANETWARSWSNISGSNVWSNVLEPNRKEGDKAVLLEQDYGNKEQWEEHYKYLNNFFLDSRYIKINNKPLFLVYKVSKIPCFREMVNYWNELAIKAGFGGVFIVGANCNGMIQNVSLELMHEPVRSIGILRDKVSNWKNDILRFDYEEVWKEIINSSRYSNKSIFGGFVGYDDTPRRGMEGVVVENASPSVFGKYLAMLMKKNERIGNDLIFINAWNEWGEGMHLEPDKINGFKYLEQISIAKATYKNIEMEESLHTDNSIEVQGIINQRNKFKMNMDCLDKWVMLLEHGIRVEDYFVKNNIKKIGIYGYGMLAKHIIEQLKNSNIHIACIIDKQKNKLHSDIGIYEPSDILPTMDAIIVAVPFFYDEVCDEMSRINSYRLISIEKVLSDLEDYKE